MDEPVFVIDLGGTWLRTGMFEPTSLTLLEYASVPTPPTAAECRASIDTEWRRCGALQRVGLAAAPILGEAGRVVRWPNVSHYQGDAILSEEISRRATVAVIDDAAAAAISAYAAWNMTPATTVLCVSIGTGIGGGAVVFGKPLLGQTGKAMDIGHVRVPSAADHECICGKRGCVQSVASGRILAAAGSSESALSIASRALEELLEILESVFEPTRIAISGGAAIDLALDARLKGKRDSRFPRVEEHPCGLDASLVGGGLFAGGTFS